MITAYLQTLIISTFFFFVFTHKFGEDCPIPRIETSCKRDSSIRTDSVMICNIFTSRTLLTRESSVVFTSRKVVVSIHECYYRDFFLHLRVFQAMVDFVVSYDPYRSCDIFTNRVARTNRLMYSRVVLSIRESYQGYLGFVCWIGSVSCTSCGAF